MGGLRSGLLKGLGSSLLVALAACGGRTSTLDPDAAYLEPNRPSASSTAGSGNSGPGPSTGTGGASSTPAPFGKGGTQGSGTPGNTGATGNIGNGPATATAGSGPVPIPAGGTSTGGSAGAAGAGGATALDPWLVSECNDFCKTSTSPRSACPRTLTNAECTSACLNELSGTGDAICQKYGGSLLECLTSVYKNSSNCADVDQLSLAKCGALFTSYQNCAFGTPGPAPVPPVPVPAPPPKPVPAPPSPGSCSTSFSFITGKCDLSLKCTDGSYYSVYCSDTSDNQTECSCSANFADGSASTGSLTLNESARYACSDSLSVCGFPQLGLK